MPLATIVSKKYLNKITLYKVKYSRNDRTGETSISVTENDEIHPSQFSQGFLGQINMHLYIQIRIVLWHL